MPALTVEKLTKKYSKLGLRVVAGRSGLQRIVSSPSIQKPGLVLLGHVPLDPHRIQVLGSSEMAFLTGLPEAEMEQSLERLLSPEVPCVVITGSLEIPPLVLERADLKGVPLLRTALSTGEFISTLSKSFDEATRRTTTLHGVLMDVLGVGVLITGKSGVGKSEAALDLILRGHRLIADDVVDISVGPDQVAVGSCSEVIKHHMEVRGLGIINIRELFGVTAIADAKAVDLVVELVDWDQRREYDRIGLDERFFSILDAKVPLLQVPVSPGRSVTTVIEVAARNHLLKRQGVHSAQRFQAQLSWAMGMDRALGGDDDEGEGDL